MPWTPIADSASLTSSSLNGLMIAVTSFMVGSPEWGAGNARPALQCLESFLQKDHAGAVRNGFRIRAGGRIAAAVIAEPVGAAGIRVIGAHRHGIKDLRQLAQVVGCLLYTSDAADERSSVDLGG